MEERKDNNEKSVEIDETEALTAAENAPAVEDMPSDLHTDNSVAEEKDMPEASAPAAKKKAVARKDMTALQWTWHEMKRNKVAYLMIAPFMLVFLTFTVFPVVLSIILSFTSFNMLEMNADMWIH